MGLSQLLYPLYERRLAKALDPTRFPQHVGVILDGNRRWARSIGETPSVGHQAGADKIEQFLTWCDELGIKHVTLWLLSTDNLSRAENELSQLLAIIDDTVQHLARTGKWRLNVVGSMDLLPPDHASHIKSACEKTMNAPGAHVNVAIGYGGRNEIADAVRSLLLEQEAKGADLKAAAEAIDTESISAHLYTAGQPDPDLVIRTSGEQRLGGFLLWQSAHSEFYFCEAYWPDFRRIDFLRALRSYAARERRFGS